MLARRDPFARQEMHRITVRTNETCAWCGRERIGSKARGNYLFRYMIETDGGTTRIIKGLFCSVDCMRTCHG